MLSRLTCAQPHGCAGGSPGRLVLLTQRLAVYAGPCLSAALAFPASLLERLKIDYFFKRTPHLPLLSLPDSFSLAVMTPLFLSCSLLIMCLCQRGEVVSQSVEGL